MLKVFVISGHAQNGKDTVANMLSRHLEEDGNKVLITHFADLLKYICAAYFDWDGQKDEKGRHLLQYVGTDVIRRKKPDFWVDFIASILSIFNKTWDYVIIPDTRFPNEINKLRERGFDVSHMRVVRPDYVSNLTPEQQKHPSETALDDVPPDNLIVNNGSLEDLEKLITHFTKEEIYGHRG